MRREEVVLGEFFGDDVTIEDVGDRVIVLLEGMDGLNEIVETGDYERARNEFERLKLSSAIGIYSRFVALDFVYGLRLLASLEAIGGYLNGPESPEQVHRAIEIFIDHATHAYDTKYSLPLVPQED